MQISVYRKGHFNAAHRLHVEKWTEKENQEYFGLCNNPNYHGHNYQLEVKLSGEIDPVSGYLFDMKLLKEIMKEEVEDRFDHKNLNLDTEEFRSLNPTAENIAVVIWNLLRKRLPDNLSLSIRLYETERNYVEFSGN